MPFVIYNNEPASSLGQHKILAVIRNDNNAQGHIARLKARDGIDATLYPAEFTQRRGMAPGWYINPSNGDVNQHLTLSETEIDDKTRNSMLQRLGHAYTEANKQIDWGWLNLHTRPNDFRRAEMVLKYELPNWLYSQTAIMAGIITATSGTLTQMFTSVDHIEEWLQHLEKVLMSDAAGFDSPMHRQFDVLYKAPDTNGTLISLNQRHEANTQRRLAVLSDAGAAKMQPRQPGESNPDYQARIAQPMLPTDFQFAPGGEFVGSKYILENTKIRGRSDIFIRRAPNYFYQDPDGSDGTFLYSNNSPVHVHLTEKADGSPWHPSRPGDWG